MNDIPTTIKEAKKMTMQEKAKEAHAHSCSVSSGSSHTHTRGIVVNSSGDYGMVAADNFAIKNSTITTSSSGNHSHTVNVGSAGSGQAFSVLNPYIVRYAWERIS